ncbi:Xaa-Pro dipeptidase [Lactobacillus nasalidis]|uniref:Xaa-Pro dipeptidase n=1 Tax=Lactobacillus nasalidis TaxID=2797258 RepID=A0ABQ3W2Q7_9LACO|nr:Xaa-Pro peptidase family protein [Lactobacillus nasalidis]GHV98208.1 Xaa-Pro dipeptidase [Lactobacillus nasalidis]GHW00167.1 Xaa-Pro dipeptidase [Lactobacillus nasalidis]GHW00601.1 Xaa-Pro dipeptidase [Lactobacillus nasalidis]
MKEERKLIWQDHLSALTAYLDEENIDLAYVADPVDIAYLTGYSSWTEERVFALLVSRTGQALLLAPAINEGEVAQTAWADRACFYQDGENPWEKAKEKMPAWPKEVWALEARAVSLGHYRAIKEVFPKANLEADISPWLAGQRMIKSPAEIEKLQAAGRQADLALALAFALLKEGQGMSESELALELDYQLKKRKVGDLSFPLIVQAGESAASVSSLPGQKGIQAGDMVIFDLGVMKDGYASDVSRTVALGEISPAKRKIYETVRLAQETAAKAAKPGMTAGELDQVARGVIEQAGYGQYFTHRLGHGIGMQVHEPVNLEPGSEQKLEAGMCFSIEPGIYLPGVGGVRIEDCGYLGEEGFHPFTKTRKDLLLL